MHNHIYLEIFDDTAKTTYVVSCKLPVQIGKQAIDDNQVLLDPVYDRISRVHGAIEHVAGRGYFYLDRSTNGSRVGGLLLRNARQSLAPGFEIQIENYRLRKVQQPTPLVLAHTNALLAALGQRELLPGRGIGVKHDAEGCRLCDLNRWTEWHEPTMVSIEIRAGGARLVVADKRKAQRVQINKFEVKEATRDLKAGDVLEIDRERFVLLTPDEKHIVCGNAACHLINPYHFEANCKWCGFHLGATGGGSFVIEGTIP